MKKFLLSMAAGAMALSATAAPVFAEEGKGTTNIGYTDGAVTDPDNPSNPQWSVSVPKDFVFVKDSGETQEMNVKLNKVGTEGLDAAKKVQIDVASANGFTLENATNPNGKTTLVYELTYGTKLTANGTIGNLTTDADEIAGTAVLPHDQLTEVGVEGTYTDVLTYTIHSAVNK